jgi:hypothetical protein
MPVGRHPGDEFFDLVISLQRKRQQALGKLELDALE